MISHETPDSPPRRRRGRPPKNAKPVRAASITVDRPREIRVRQTETPPRPVQGARRALVNFSLFAVLAAACASLLFGFRSQKLKVSEVDVKGASPELAAHLASAVAPDCQPGPAKQAFVFRCNAADPLAPSVLSVSSSDLAQEFGQLPQVQSVQVQTALPGRVLLSVSQRQPEAGWIVGSHTFRVSADGTVLDEGPADGLKVVIDSADATAVRPGDKIDPAAIRGAEELQDRLSHDLGLAVRQIHYSAVDGLSVVGQPNLTAMFGSADNLGPKLAELQAILQLTKDKKTAPTFVDVRYKTPYYRVG